MNRAALVLAAGAGSRFGGGKLSAPFKGEPLIRHAIRAARAAPVDRVIVVSAPDLELGQWSGPPEVDVIRLTSPALSDSLRAGLKALKAYDAVFVFLGDMPLIPHGIAEQLVALLPGHFAAVPRQGERSGHPVLLSRAAMAAAQHLRDDEGAGKLLRARRDVAILPIEDEAAFLDVDRREDLGRLETGQSRL